MRDCVRPRAAACDPGDVWMLLLEAAEARVMRRSIANGLRARAVRFAKLLQTSTTRKERNSFDEAPKKMLEASTVQHASKCRSDPARLGWATYCTLED